jgi:hypothetical protein
MREIPGIDVVTRLYDLADLPHLDQLIFSLMGQTDAMPVQLHIMLQRFTFTEVQRVREATWRLRRLRDRTSMTLHNWDYPAPFDLRVPMLNWGLEVAQARYITCLDVYDRLCPHACAALLARLCGTEAALALGGTALQPVLWWDDVMVPIPEQADELAVPTPVFVADRSRIAVKDCVFRTGEPDLEIAEFIERLRGHYPVDTACQGKTVALRIYPIS